MRRVKRGGRATTLASPLPLTEDISARGETYPGMCHWAGGTPGRFCGECSSYRSKGWYADGTQMQGYCTKARAHIKRSLAFPPYARACKYFSPGEEKPRK